MAEKLRQLTTLNDLVLKFNKPGLKNKVNFYRLMAITQKAGLGVRDALLTILKSENHEGLKIILEDIVGQVNKGQNLASSMEKHRYFFGLEEIELIRSSETIGNMPETLEDISKELENHQKLVAKLKNALTYPTVIIIFAMIAVVILLVKVIPVIVSLFPDPETLPGITKFMLWLSDYLQNFWFLIIIFVVGLVVTYQALYKLVLPFKIFIDRYLLKVPAIGPFVKFFNLYRFSKLMGDFYNAGVSPTVALEQIADILKNYHYQTKCRNIRQDLEMGLRFSDSIEGSWLFDPILIQIIGIGEDTGDIGEVLNKMADFYRDEIDFRLEGLMKMIEPLLMGFVAIIVGVIVASIFLPMGDLIGTLGS